MNWRKFFGQGEDLLGEFAQAEQPLRSELFSTEQMAQHGRVLAESHSLLAGKGPDRLLARLSQNDKLLRQACQLLLSAIKADRRISPAGDWLLDNFYLIEEQIRTARRHFPKGYSWELPRLKNGPSAGLPRVYDIALEAISHGDGRVDQDSLSRFVANYQDIAPLKLGELWAIPIMLRLALIENLRRVAVRIANDRLHRNLASGWADQMIDTAQTDPKSLILVIADMARSTPPMEGAFVAELTRRLQGQSAVLALPVTWIEQWLTESGLTIEQLVQAENQQQAADQVSISNSIGSLRALAVTDWREFVETMSHTESVLREDPADVYTRMDFASRDCYRHVVEHVAKHSQRAEIDLAKDVLALARQAADALGEQAPAAHVGYYLIGVGFSQLETKVQMRVTLGERLRRLGEHFPLWLFLGVLAAITLLLAGAVLFDAHAAAWSGWRLVLLAGLVVVAASQLALTIMNWFAAMISSPRTWARMDYSAGLPANARTLVVIPTLLTGVSAAEALVEDLQIRYLANCDDHLHFALLTDFPDANQQVLEQDALILEAACAGIASLNQQYASPERDVFFLFHRPRRWNERERVWMGEERKRGKLSDLNALLRGDPGERFERVVGHTEILVDVRYVITLDTDTQLPRDSARELVATLMHPLHRSVYDDKRRRVVDGYAILQPRVGTSASALGSSRYAKLFGGDPGIDPYTRGVSDVYQDLFSEGSFIGKGIYELDAFERALGERFPDNRILSHDLLEGCYARSGLVSDVELFEQYPSRYSSDVKRRHRWIRGDWQIAGWLLRRVPGFHGKTEANPLSALSQWKILDNLRRSLVPAALLALLLLGWRSPALAGLWTLATLSVLFLPVLVDSLLELFHKIKDAPLQHHLATAMRSAGRRLAQALFTLACLPFEAYFSLDAIVRTLWRLTASRRHLLEWTPSSTVEGAADQGFGGALRAMWIAPTLAIAVAAYLITERAYSLLFATPILLLWLLAPAFAEWVSLPSSPPRAALDAADAFFLRKLARRTWAFFQRFVGEQDNWLPPDNFQETPVAAVAHRTSPTNIGLALLANLSAWDFGYLSQRGLVQRCTDTFSTLRRLERYRGHLYNWYDTESLKPLLPMYVSTVDSGNLVGHLLTLRQGLLALVDEPILGVRTFLGLADTFGVLDEVAGAQTSPAHERFRVRIAVACEVPAYSASAAHGALKTLAALADDLLEVLTASNADEAIRWAQMLARQCREALQELQALTPWCVTAAPGAYAEGIALRKIPTLAQLNAGTSTWIGDLLSASVVSTSTAEHEWIAELHKQVANSAELARERIERIEQLAGDAAEFAEVDYDFLYDPARKLFAIGYNLTDRRRDVSFYDLLASEARLCNFVAIAQGKVPQESWFALGRLLTNVGGESTLLSWSGSMFEYLMPMLVMPTFHGTLLYESCRASVRRQIAYGNQRDVPWGISESGYNLVDAALNYQYRAFGVPGLGLKRGLSEDLVIAPYATVLALMVAPEEACENLRRLVGLGALGNCGFYEAIDYTASRLRRGETSVLVRSFMAHHQGMSLLSLGHLLLDLPMQRRFEADPQMRATMLLLQERVPKATAYYSNDPELVDLRSVSDTPEMPVRVFNRADTLVPGVQLLSNGRYHVMITNAGGGYSRFRDIAVTRWREDTTRDDWGTFCYVREVDKDAFWSTAYQPTLRSSDIYEATFNEPRVEFRRRNQNFDTYTEIVVSPEDDIELRRTRITNRSRVRKTIEVTSYAEVVLAPAIADALHPAFGNLFVQTQIDMSRQAILCRRRPRSATEKTPWMFHLLAVHGAESSQVSFETDRSKFIGRGNSSADPIAMRQPGGLSCSEGSVLDPIVAIRRRITLEPEQSVTLDLVIGIGENQESCLVLVDKYQDQRLADRVFDLAWTHSQVALRQINVSEIDAQVFCRLAGSIIYGHASLRADASVVSRNRRGQSGLWGYAISGDLPIVLLQIKDPAKIDLVRQLVQAHAYWRMKGLAVDLVIWNEDRGGYRQMLHDQIMGLIAAGAETNVIDRPGGVFVRNVDQIAAEDRILLQSVARAIISDTRGTLAEQVRRREPADSAVPRFSPSRMRSEVVPALPMPANGRELQLFNGLGGFSADGREYVITTSSAAITPAPWINVLANPFFGAIVSESGGGYTWKENAHEFRLSPWDNDPVSDASGEAFYLRDEESGQFWSPTPLPARGSGSYTTRHGFGYSVFEHVQDGIASELWMYVAFDAPVKFFMLKTRNISGRPRKLSATGYIEWVLGDLRSKSIMHVVTELDPNSGALFASNAYNPEFADQVAFFDVDDAKRTLSGDRAEFIGRNGSLRNPAAMSRAHLSGKVGATMDPCAAIQIPFELVEGQSREIIFRLGVGRGSDDANELVLRFRKFGTARASLDEIDRYWRRTLSAVRVQTPDPALNLLANGWLLYQVIACRLWARSGYYQSGGAFGFRDQLQDAMALVHSEPQRLRAQLLMSAARQFKEGDVQHWWHPPTGRGVRTHCSDDFLWLPLATCRYLQASGDMEVLHEPIGFIEGRALHPDEDSYYDLPLRSNESASLYQHCVRAIEHALRMGVHGLPLIGCGDWNDGMSNVGMQGRGESVWLGFFLADVLRQFSVVAQANNDDKFAAHCSEQVAQLKRNIERDGWDGAWYRRAYFDDGTPLGSASNQECQIDSISQSWAVLSGVGSAQRTAQALDALDARLVRDDAALIQLLDPPFDKGSVDPGYIRGYVPGVRENGGQYTHAAIWATMAFAAAGRIERAWEMFTMINPLRHADNAEKAAIYKVEPYVVAADVYAVAPHVGRGGWTWYTGSAGWMYRLIVESLLGISREPDRLRLAPRLPAGWSDFSLDYRYGETAYRIRVRRAAGADSVGVDLDGARQADNSIALRDDGQQHEVQVWS